MDDRWKEIERLYHAALEREKSAGPAFLAQACARDEGLRREVESLLAADEQAENFLKTPAIEEATQALASEETEGNLEEDLQLASTTILSRKTSTWRSCSVLICMCRWSGAKATWPCEPSLEPCLDS